MSVRKIRAVDLYSGAGGFSQGLAVACGERGLRLELTAVNHWAVSVETHAANHPSAAHHCADVGTLEPTRAVPGGKVDILMASPACQHHSRARGGRPVQDQARATGWGVIQWAEQLRPSVVLVENVKEYLHWGPVGTNGKPLKSRRGETFRAWVSALTSLGYRVSCRVLNIAAGLVRHCGAAFTVQFKGTGADQLPGTARDAGEPLGTVTAGGGNFGVAEPFIVPTNFGERAGQAPRTHPVGRPLPTVTGGACHALVEPFLMQTSQSGGNGGYTRRVDDPLAVVTTNNDFRLVEPMLLGQQSGAVGRPVSEPAPTVATSGAIALIEPYLVSYYANGGPRSVANPLDTVTTRDRFGLVEGTTLDILFRMLTAGELAAAMGFPAGYVFKGNRGDVIKQIGNAVACNMAHALCGSILDGRFAA